MGAWGSGTPIIYLGYIRCIYNIGPLKIVCSIIVGPRKRMALWKRAYGGLWDVGVHLRTYGWVGWGLGRTPGAVP